MKTVYEMHPMVRRLLPDQVSVSGTAYRPITFCFRMEVSEGLAIFNVLTKQYLLLEGREADALNEVYPESVTARKLVQDYFLVPVDHDDRQLCREVLDFFTAIHDKQNDGKLTSYTILPTTNCNARCYYCYEAGIRRVDMTDEMAHRVADYIRKTHRDNHAMLRWFGGEPLYNARAIDIICQDLSEMGIEYHSSMTSNAYLFDEALVKKAVDEWKLGAIQITLDGTATVYNRTKAYISKEDANPFARVMRNIELLVRAGVLVNIRLNLSEDNYEDLCALVKLVSPILSKDGTSSMYVHPLFHIEAGDDEPLKETMHRQHTQLIQLIEREMKWEKQFSALKRDLERKGCQATEGDAIVIDPEGVLFPCEHVNEVDSCGTIDHDEGKFADLDRQREREPEIDACAICPFYPDCGRRAYCPVKEGYCTLANREKVANIFAEKMKNELNHYLHDNT